MIQRVTGSSWAALACALAAVLCVGCGGSGGKTKKPPTPPGVLAISGITPNGGAPGTVVTVTGSGFTDGTVSVVVGGVPSPGVTIISDNVLTYITPGGTGNVTVVVTTGAGAAAVPGGFTFDGFVTSVVSGSTQRVRVGDELRFTIAASLAGSPASARLVNPVAGMHFDPSVTGVTPGSQMLRWIASRHAAGRHRLKFIIPGSSITFTFDVRVYGISDFTGTGTLIGDVTGDGILDVVAGASSADGAAVDSGLVYVFAGGAAPLSAPSAILSVPGAAGSDFLGGDAAAGAGSPGSGQLLQLADVTGDGILDIVAGAPTADIGAVDDGAIYVWAGGAALTGGATPIPDATLITGGIAGDQLCGTKDNSQGLILEDVTGDGITDIIGVSPFHDSTAVDAGAIFVWPGGGALVGAGVLIAPGALAATGGFGGTAGSLLGRGSVPGSTEEGQGCQVADVTGDGINDIVAVAKLDDVIAVDSGICLVWAGGPGLIALAAPTANLFDPGASVSDGLGHIANDGGMHLADVTADGVNDVILGAAFLDGGVVDEGAVFVWAGGAGLPGTPLPTAVCLNSAAIAGDQMGFTEAVGAFSGPRRGISIGDVTGDGTADIVACASLADTGVVDGGAVHVFAGGVGLTGPVAPVATCSDPLATASDFLGANSRSGSSVNLVDVSGDGVNDIVVPSPKSDIGAVDDGAIFVFNGGATLTGAVAPSAVLGTAGTAGDFIGRVSVSGTGNGHALHFEDVTGDGIRDIVAASPFFDLAGVNDGAILIWNGGATLTGALIPDSGLGVAGTSSFGAAQVSTAGEGGVQIVDITGDGILDITVNDPQGTHLAMANAGVLHVWAGGTIALSPPPTASLGGMAAGDAIGFGSGFPVVFGDINQDGVDDIVSAGPDGFGGPPAGGHVFFWPGGAAVTGTPGPTVVMFDPATVVFGSGIGSTLPYDGVNAQEMFLADITGDGGPDVVGTDARHSRSGAGLEGAVHLWAGPALAPAPTVTFLDPAATSGDQLGRVK